MIKIVAAVAGAVLVAGAAVLLSGMTPLVSQNTAQNTTSVAVKGDRLDIRTFGPGCSERGWPYYEANCIRRADGSRDTRKVRIVTLDHLPADIRFAIGR